MIKEKKIINNGRIAASLFLPRLKEIAAHQKHEEKREPIQKIDSFYLKEVHFHGNDHFSRSYLRGKMHFGSI